MKLINMTDGDIWDLMLDYHPNFYTGEEGGDEDGNEQEPDDNAESEC